VNLHLAARQLVEHLGATVVDVSIAEDRASER